MDGKCKINLQETILICKKIQKAVGVSPSLKKYLKFCYLLTLEGVHMAPQHSACYAQRPYARCRIFCCYAERCKD